MATDVLDGAAPPGEPASPSSACQPPARERRPRRWLLITLVAGAAVAVTAGGVVGYGTATYAGDYDGRMLPTTVVAGVDVSGMTPADALGAVEAAIAPELDRSVAVRWEEETWETTPADLGATSDAEEAVAEAAEASAHPGLVDYARMRWLGEELSFDRDVTVTYSAEGARAFVDDIAADVNRPATDAAIDSSSGWVEFADGSDGLVADTAATGEALHGAVTGGGDEVQLVTHRVAPELGLEDFDQVLLLRQREHKLYLYENREITHTWDVAVGTGDHPTPVGHYSVTLKRYMPTWVNPSPTGWGASMPARIGPGVNNPLGVRAINWDAPAIRFHGTANVSSIGTDASKGCVRLTNDDVVELYDLVREGARIVSVRE